MDAYPDSPNAPGIAAEAGPGHVRPVVGRLHDPDVLRGIIYRNTMQRLSDDDDDAPMYVTAQDMQDSIDIAAEMREANVERERGQDDE